MINKKTKSKVVSKEKALKPAGVISNAKSIWEQLRRYFITLGIWKYNKWGSHSQYTMFTLQTVPVFCSRI